MPASQLAQLRDRFINELGAAEFEQTPINGGVSVSGSEPAQWHVVITFDFIDCKAEDGLFELRTALQLGSGPGWISELQGDANSRVDVVTQEAHPRHISLRLAAQHLTVEYGLGEPH